MSETPVAHRIDTIQQFEPFNCPSCGHAFLAESTVSTKIKSLGHPDTRSDNEAARLREALEHVERSARRYVGKKAWDCSSTECWDELNIIHQDVKKALAQEGE